jgi:hypothetical protein
MTGVRYKARLQTFDCGGVKQGRFAIAEGFTYTIKAG